MCFKIKIILKNNRHCTVKHPYMFDKQIGCTIIIDGWTLHLYIYIYIYSLKNKNVLVDIRKVTMVISERNLLNSDDVLLCSFTFTYGLKFIYRNTD
jgi:hypothetical protein